MGFERYIMKYFCIHAALGSEARELSINEKQTAEFAAGNINDDPVNLDRRKNTSCNGYKCCIVT